MRHDADGMVHSRAMNCYLGYGEIESPADEVTVESQTNLVKAHVDWFHLILI